jgi:tetratricopeptide (TPR) repeat protein
MKLIKSIVIIIIGYLSLSSQIILGQLGNVRITVVDSRGRPINNVKVTMLNDNIFDFKREIFTDDKGIAICVGLRPDVYVFVFEKEGYSTKKENIKIRQMSNQEEITLLTIEEALEQAKAKNPLFQAVNKYNEAIKYTGNKEYDKAIFLLKEAITLDENLSQAYFEIGKIYYLKNMFNEAVEPLKKTIALKEDNVPAYKLLAICYEKLGKKEEAEKYYIIAKNLSGPSGIDKYNEAVKFLNERDIENAIVLLQEAIKLDPLLADAFYELGMAFLNKGNKEKAKANLEKYLELNPQGEKVSIARTVLEVLKKSQ